MQKCRVLPMADLEPRLLWFAAAIAQDPAKNQKLQERGGSTLAAFRTRLRTVVLRLEAGPETHLLQSLSFKSTLNLHVYICNYMCVYADFELCMRHAFHCSCRTGLPELSAWRLGVPLGLSAAAPSVTLHRLRASLGEAEGGIPELRYVEGWRRCRR